MGKIKKALPVKLFCGFIFSEEQIYQKARSIFEHKFGRIDFESRTLDFNYTDYYEKELGKDLKRKFITVTRLIYPADLYKIKLITNEIEASLSRNKLRLINIDPGYLNLSKIVLASTKDYYHRIYLNKGIFAELTLFYQGKAFKALNWTYPDYKTPEYSDIFLRIREIYVDQVKDI